MKIYKNFEINKNFKRSILAIGNFDGMHKGHQKVLNLALKKAKKENLKCGILSFEPSPFIFFTKNVSICLLILFPSFVLARNLYFSPFFTFFTRLSTDRISLSEF